MKRHLDADREDDKLQYFIAAIDDVMDELMADASPSGFVLDYTVSSVDTLERYVFERDVTLDDSDIDVRTRCWTYLGEVVRRNAGGTWQVSMNDDNTANHGLYVIEGHFAPGVEFVPIRYIRALIAKRQRGFLRAVIRSHGYRGLDGAVNDRD